MGIRPSMDFLRKGFSTIGFHGDFQLGLLDAQHVLIRFSMPTDYHRCWMHGTWHFKTYTMKVLKWTPDFSPESEPPIVPVWVSFENLPIHFFQKDPLLSLAALLGKPLKIDAATINLTRPSVARVCVEINLNQQLPKRIWIRQGASGFWQSVIYENLPDYCKDCSCLGHASGNCNFTSDVPSFNPNKRVWLPKKVQVGVKKDHEVPEKKQGVVDVSSTSQMIDVPVQRTVISSSPLSKPKDTLKTQEVGFTSQLVEVDIPTKGDTPLVEDTGASPMAADNVFLPLRPEVVQEHLPQEIESQAQLTQANVNNDDSCDTKLKLANRIEVEAVGGEHAEDASIQFDSNKDNMISMEQPNMVSPVPSAPSPVAANSCSTHSIFSKTTNLSAPPVMESHVELEDESEYDDELFEEIIIQDKNGQLSLITKPKKFQGSSSAPPNVPGTLAAHSIHISDSQQLPQIDTNQDASNQEETLFQQQKHRWSKKKKPLVQVDASWHGVVTRSKKSSFNVLSEE